MFEMHWAASWEEMKMVTGGNVATTMRPITARPEDLSAAGRRQRQLCLEVGPEDALKDVTLEMQVRHLRPTLSAVQNFGWVKISNTNIYIYMYIYSVYEACSGIWRVYEYSYWNIRWYVLVCMNIQFIVHLINACKIQQLPLIPLQKKQTTWK